MTEAIKDTLNETPDFEVKQYSADVLSGLSIFPAEINIVACTKGKCSVKLNDKSYTLKAGTNFVVKRSHHLYFESCSNDASVTIIDYSFTYFAVIYHILEKSVFDAINKYNAPDLCSAKNLAPSNLTISKIVNLYYDTAHSNRSRYLLSLTVGYFLERYEALIKCEQVKITERSNEVNHYVTRFRSLCDNLHTKERNIKVYAERLGISSRHLYEVVKNGTGLTPKQILTNYIVATAKRLLLTSTLSTQQIAFMLHFGDQSNFTQFFKQNVGETPSEFRKIYFKINEK